MTSTGTRVIAAALAVCATLAGCASATNGTGHQGSAAGTGASSSPDFPTASPPTTESASTPSATDSGTATGHPVPAQPLATHTVRIPGGATYVVKVWADVTNATCFDHAYGRPMIAFLTKHPCLGLQRVLATTTVKGRPVAFARSSLAFRGTPQDPYVYAARFQHLELQDGTGSVNDLLREGYRLPSGPTSVPSGEAFSVLGQDAGATVWDVWYLDGPTPDNAKPLIAMTQDLFLQF